MATLDSPAAHRRRIVGILLAAGAGVRFGGGKLIATMADGELLGVRSARNLRAAIPEVIAVVRPGDDALARALETAGARVTVCAEAGAGMGVSIAHGVREAGAVDGVIVALADMPWIAASTIAAVGEALHRGAALVVPSYRGARGHPVGFGA